MNLEIVYDKGQMHHEVLSNYAGMGSNEAVDTRGNKYEYDNILQRWDKREDHCVRVTKNV